MKVCQPNDEVLKSAVEYKKLVNIGTTLILISRLLLLAFALLVLKTYLTLLDYSYSMSLPRKQEHITYFLLLASSVVTARSGYIKLTSIFNRTKQRTYRELVGIQVQTSYFPGRVGK